MGVTNERHPASITTTSLTLICGIVAGTVYITFQYLTGEKAIAGAAAIFAALMLRLHLVGYHWKKNISNSLLLLLLLLLVSVLSGCVIYFLQVKYDISCLSSMPERFWVVYPS
jgi:membrane associated rhomboid family serine protease